MDGVGAGRGRTVDDTDDVDRREETDMARRRKGRRGRSKSSSSSCNGEKIKILHHLPLGKQNKLNGKFYFMLINRGSCSTLVYICQLIGNPILR